MDKYGCQSLLLDWISSTRTEEYGESCGWRNVIVEPPDPLEPLLMNLKCVQGAVEDFSRQVLIFFGGVGLYEDSLGRGLNSAGCDT